MDPKRKKLLIVVSLVIGTLLIGGLVAFGIYRSRKDPTTIQPDVYSYNRMTALHQVLTSYFGRNWPFVFLGYGILIIIILFLLYLVSKNGITLSDQNFKKWSRIAFWFGIILSIGVITLGVFAYLRWRKEKKEQSEKDGDWSPSTRASRLIQLIGMGVIVVVLLVIILWVIIHEIRSHKKNKTSIENI